MTQINSPFLLPKLRPIRELSPQENNYLAQLERIVQQIYRRVGGGIDIIDEDLQEASANESQIALNLALIETLKQRVEDLENDIQPQIDFSPKCNDITITSNYDAAPWDDITAKQAVTITLPSQPSPDSVIIVRNGDGSKIVVDGNGIKIRRKRLTDKLATKNSGSSLCFRYKIDVNEYVL